VIRPRKPIWFKSSISMACHGLLESRGLLLVPRQAVALFRVRWTSLRHRHKSCQSRAALPVEQRRRPITSSFLTNSLSLFARWRGPFIAHTCMRGPGRLPPLERAFTVQASDCMVCSFVGGILANWAASDRRRFSQTSDFPGRAIQPSSDTPGVSARLCFISWCTQGKLLRFARAESAHSPLVHLYVEEVIMRRLIPALTAALFSAVTFSVYAIDEPTDPNPPPPQEKLAKKNPSHQPRSSPPIPRIRLSPLARECRKVATRPDAVIQTAPP
jgi:hypothetical protein